MRALLDDTGFRTVRFGPGTWPSDAALRLPIDHVLLRGDAGLAGMETLGADLGSNHLGIVADIVLP
jgi:endonuclease/exonuclease/phosphatase (EEP) superfamily protein YafD